MLVPSYKHGTPKGIKGYYIMVRLRPILSGKSIHRSRHLPRQFALDKQPNIVRYAPIERLGDTPGYTRNRIAVAPYRDSFTDRTFKTVGFQERNNGLRH